MSEKVWTVVGVWVGDNPLPVGTIEGDHQVVGGFYPDTMIEFEGGVWAVAVTADTDDEAESAAVEEMLTVLDDERH